MTQNSQNKYLEALESAVGAENFNFVLSVLTACSEKMGKSGFGELEHCAKNSERASLLDKWFGGLLPEEIKNFIVLLSAEKKTDIIENLKKPSIKNSVMITLPPKISDKQKSNITDDIYKITGRRDINFFEDAAIVGGIKIKINDLEIDNSIQSRLKSFQNAV